MLLNLAPGTLYKTQGAPRPDFTQEIKMAAATIASRLKGEYTSILLTGAAARGEETSAPDGALASDLDFLVALPQRTAAQAMLAERRCRQKLVGYEAEMPGRLREAVSVGFAGASPRFWGVATPFMYELRANALCLDGSPDVLGWPRITLATQIPAWEGIRLVANRLCEMFGALSHYSRSGSGATTVLHYAAIKQALACSEAALIVTGQYRPTYRERFEAHERVAYLFTAAQNTLITAAYEAKLGAKSAIFWIHPRELARAVASLALHTLAITRADDPAGMRRATRLVNPDAPGPLTDLLFFATQARQGRRVPLRHAISDVYADAVALARRLASDKQAVDISGNIIADAASLYERFKVTPQVVGVV